MIIDTLCWCIFDKVYQVVAIFAEGHIHVSDMSMRCVSTLLLTEVQQHSASKHKYRIEFLSRTFMFHTSVQPHAASFIILM